MATRKKVELVDAAMTVNVFTQKPKPDLSLKGMWVVHHDGGEDGHQFFADSLPIFDVVGFHTLIFTTKSAAEIAASQFRAHELEEQAKFEEKEGLPSSSVEPMVVQVLPAKEFLSLIWGFRVDIGLHVQVVDYVQVLEHTNVGNWAKTPRDAILLARRKFVDQLMGLNKAERAVMSNIHDCDRAKDKLAPGKFIAKRVPALPKKQLQKKAAAKRKKPKQPKRR